eukprot:1157321-Amorphochlora_amoeboformis.AAC.3
MEGFAASALASVMFSLMYIPVKYYPVFDGITFQVLEVVNGHRQKRPAILIFVTVVRGCVSAVVFMLWSVDFRILGALGKWLRGYR